MTYLTLGQFSIPISWLAFLLAIIYSDFRNNNKDDTTNKILNRLLWSYLIVWKFSYILFAWSSFRLSPISLLYFDGGLKGAFTGHSNNDHPSSEDSPRFYVGSGVEILGTLYSSFSAN